MTNSVLREIAKVAIGVAVLGVLMACIILLAWGVQPQMLLGTLLGCTYAVCNFMLTAYFVSQSVKKGENAAKAYMAGSYYLRLILAAGVLFLAIKLPNVFNVYTTAIPFVFPRIVITVCGLFENVKKKNRGEEE